MVQKISRPNTPQRDKKIDSSLLLPLSESDVSSTSHSLNCQTFLGFPVLDKASLNFSFVAKNLCSSSNFQANIYINIQWLDISDVLENALNIYVILNHLLSTIHYFVLKIVVHILQRIILSIVPFFVQNSRHSLIKAILFISYTKPEKPNFFLHDHSSPQKKTLTNFQMFCPTDTFLHSLSFFA